MGYSFKKYLFIFKFYFGYTGSLPAARDLELQRENLSYGIWDLVP